MNIYKNFIDEEWILWADVFQFDVQQNEIPWLNLHTICEHVIYQVYFLVILLFFRTKLKYLPLQERVIIWIFMSYASKFNINYVYTTVLLSSTKKYIYKVTFIILLF